MSRPRATYSDDEYASPGRVVVEGSFVTKSESAPTTTTGAGWTTGAPAAAVYTITGRGGKFAGVIKAWASLRDNLVTSTKKAVLLTVVATTDPWTATIVTQSTAGTVGTLSGPIVDFEFVFRDTSATK